MSSSHVPDTSTTLHRDVAYDLQDGAGLDLPELDEPDDYGRHHIERSGSPTHLTFKGTGL